MATVTDPHGVQWRVRRRWGSSFWNDPNAWLFDAVATVATWPFWFMAHWLGLAWVVVIERDNTDDPERVVFYTVGEEKVRGWAKSGWRIQEIAESAAAGTLEQSLGLPPFTLPDGK
jgi:hypothetical protein